MKSNSFWAIQNKKWWGLTFGLTIVTALLLLVAIVLLPSVRNVQDAAKTSTCQGHFSCIALAMRNYQAQYGHFPPAFIPGKDGKPAHSWRVLLLDTIDRQAFQAYRFDEPWDGPNNRKLSANMPSCYACPADPEAKMKHQTNYFVVVGSETVFPGANAVKLEDIHRPHDETILLVESVGRSVHWMEPKDLSWDVMSFEINHPKKPSVSSNHRREPGVYMVDGSILWLTDMSPERIQEMCRIK
ncbi:MAG: DUF1559 domain-containing protein [Gemmataceae bacterium]